MHKIMELFKKRHEAAALVIAGYEALMVVIGSVFLPCPLTIGILRCLTILVCIIYAVIKDRNLHLPCVTVDEAAVIYASFFHVPLLCFFTGELMMTSCMITIMIFGLFAIKDKRRCKMFILVLLAETVLIAIIFLLNGDAPADGVTTAYLGGCGLMLFTGYVARAQLEHERNLHQGQLDLLMESNLDLEKQNNRDSLTGLLNRKYYNKAIKQLMAAYDFNGAEFSMLAFDIDKFKQVNDNFGHKAGDAALKILGRIIKENISPTDVACRMGGDEFIVLTRSGLSHAAEQAERIRRRVEDQSSDLYGDISISCGVATYRSGMSAELFYNEADSLLYTAKKVRNKVCVGWNP